jgi:hypothetical protein
MIVAKPNELDSYAVPVFTAHLTVTELLKWIPLRFTDITDPLAVPEPSMDALVKLASGRYVVLSYGKKSETLFVRAPENGDLSAYVQDFFSEVPLPRSRVTWRKPGVSLPNPRKGTPAPARPQASAKTAPSSGRQRPKARARVAPRSQAKKR